MTVDWNTIMALTAIMGVINGAALFVIKLLIESAITANNEKLIARMEGTYMKTEIANLQFSQFDTRLGAHDARLRILEDVYRDSPRRH